MSSTLAALPDEKLTEYALRLVLTGHTDTPRENDLDFLAQAEAVFASPQPKKATAKKTQTVEAESKPKAKKEPTPKKEAATKKAA